MSTFVVVASESAVAKGRVLLLDAGVQFVHELLLLVTRHCN
jgi:hypothetical protein